MLRDVMQSAGLTLYAEIGLVLIFAAFVVVVVRTFAKKPAHYDHVARLPFDDDPRSPEPPLETSAGGDHPHPSHRPSEV